MVYLVKVLTKASNGDICTRVVPATVVWFENDPKLPSGDQKYDYEAAKWLPTYDPLRRKLYTDRS